MINTQNLKRLYYSSSTISLLGSMATAVTIVPLLIANGLTLAEVGIIAGLMRISTVIIQTFFGHLPDKFGGVKSLAFCEIGAFVSTLFVYDVLVHKSTLNSWAFWFGLGMVVRMCFTGISFSSSQKIAKVIAVAENSGGNISVTISQISSGTMFLMSVVCFAFFEKLTLQNVILFDAITFLISGIIQFLLIKRVPVTEASVPQEKKYITISVLRYFKDFRFFARNDLILSIVFWGSNTLNMVLLAHDQKYIPLLPGLFGLAGVLAGNITKKIVNYSSTLPYWVVAGVCFASYPLILDRPFLVLGVSFIRNIGYWVIFNFIGKEMMKHSKEAHYAEIASGRQAFSVSALAVGEPYVGFIHSIASHSIDFFIRSGMALVGAIGTRKKHD